MTKHNRLAGESFVPQITMLSRKRELACGGPSKAFRYHSALFAVCLALLSFGPVLAQASEVVPPSETWMGVYLQGQKIGYLKMALSNTQYEGKDAYRMESLIHTKFLIMGAEMRQDIRTLVFTDLNSSPLFQEFEMTSKGQASKIEAVFKPEVVQCKLLSQGTTTTKDVIIPPGTKLIGDSTFYSAGKKLTVGDKVSMSYFNPLRLSIDELSIEVTGREKLEIKDKTYDTVVIKSTLPMGEMTSWQNDNGEVIKMLAVMGMTMIRESKEEAMGQETGAAYQPPKDFAVLTSVKTDVEIKDPNRVAHMRAIITGMPNEKLVVTDARQRAVWSVKDNIGSVEYTIRARKADGLGSAIMPFTAEAMQPYLAEAPYMQVADPEIKKQADQIIGKERRSFFAASKIRKWVHDNMRMQADIGIVRSAVDVYNNRVGVCRDYAILYTALARAAGIPTRIAAGLVFFNGSFYYHAWAESYTGRWTPFDPTLPTDFVDATHVKFVHGDATSMFELASVIGGLNAQILSYEYLEK